MKCCVTGHISSSEIWRSQPLTPFPPAPPLVPVGDAEKGTRKPNHIICSSSGEVTAVCIPTCSQVVWLGGRLHPPRCLPSSEGTCGSLPLVKGLRESLHIASLLLLSLLLPQTTSRVIGADKCSRNGNLPRNRYVPQSEMAKEPKSDRQTHTSLAASLHVK